VPEARRAGLACGDALGTTVEFADRGTFEPVRDSVGGGPFNLQAGQWTDDTFMALCLAASLLHRNGFAAVDQMNRYVNWWQWGYLSSTGECFDIGSTTRRALGTYLVGSDPFSGSTDPRAAGNGSLMRLAPVPLFFHGDRALIFHYAAESSRTTHAAQEAVDWPGFPVPLHSSIILRATALAATARQPASGLLHLTESVTSLRGHCDIS
jgi:ADP-ribosyl-[dinitrogen reductase] hydrolase